MNTYANFYYDPSRQGYDVTQWRTLSGTPGMLGNNLTLTNSATVGYADLWRGKFSFGINSSGPSTGQLKQFGLTQVSLGAYILFSLAGTTFKVAASDGKGNVSTSSVTGDWNSAWSGVDTEFTIKWEAGTAKFFINDVQVAAITSAAITGQPMSLYASNGNADVLSINYISCTGIQGYIWNYESTGANVTTGGFSIYDIDKVSSSDVITNTKASLAGISVNDIQASTENQTESAPA